MTTPNITKQDAAESIKAGFLEIADWVDASMISDTAKQLDLTTQTVRNYIDGKFITGERSRLHVAASVLMILRTKVTLVKSVANTTNAALSNTTA